MSSYNTIKRQPRSTLKYSTRMTLAFALTAVMTAVVLSIVLAFVWERQFQMYTRANMQRMVEQMAESLSQQYGDAQKWTDASLDYLEATSGSMPEVGMRLVDENGAILYDDSAEGTGSVRGAHARLVALPLQESSIVSAPIEYYGGNDGSTAARNVGTITFWSVSSDALLTQSDSQFKTSSYGAIITAASMAVVFACIIGVFVARALTDPIKRITTTASQIRNGDLTARTGLAGSDEIGRLGETFDDMASTLE
ncbi:MAG: HAMP domain-containing protein, partial [Atopobiaceae bacterium]|nr:HAMP domain-containing protein [Atopobiaceae bacterium]